MFTSVADFGSLAPAFGSMRHELERAFDSINANGRVSGMHLVCPISMWQDDKHVYVAADVPGISRDQLSLTFEDGKLWLRGDRSWNQNDGSFEYNERRFSRFERGIALPETVDPSTIEAVLEDGVLRVSLTKRSEAQPKTIEIRQGSVESVKKISD